MFPFGVLYDSYPDTNYYYNRYDACLSCGLKIGYEGIELLPGLYEYRRAGDNRVEGRSCNITLNDSQDNETKVQMTYGEPFTFQFYTYHEKVRLEGLLGGCQGALYRIGD